MKMLRLLYRQAMTYRYVIVSVLAILFVVIVSWTEEEYIFNAHAEIENSALLAKRGDRQHYTSIQPSNGAVNPVGRLPISSKKRPSPRKVVHTIVEDANKVNVKTDVVDDDNDDVDDGDGDAEIGESQTLPPVERQCPPQGQASQVILLTYGRSGSSLTADILQHNDDVFFHYEPLHNLAKSFTRIQRDYGKRYREHLYLTAIPEYNKIAENVVQMLLTCNYTHLVPEAYKNLHLIRSASTRPLHNCIRNKAVNDREKIQECLSLHSTRCSFAPMQLIKTIRFTAESVGHLMSKFPNLKMIYLMRDPRGSYLSKLKAFPADFSRNATYEARRICPRYKKDIDETLRLYKQYPKRVYITRYESIAEDPVEMSRRLYHFLCLDFSPAIENYIVNTIMGGSNKTDKDIYAVRRKDSKAASYAWRSKMDIKQVTAFDELCSDVYEKFGYLTVDDEDHLRDLEVPLKVDKEFLL